MLLLHDSKVLDGKWASEAKAPERLQAACPAFLPASEGRGRIVRTLVLRRVGYGGV